jgi:hypothetical protein
MSESGWIAPIGESQGGRAASVEGAVAWDKWRHVSEPAAPSMQARPRGRTRRTASAPYLRPSRQPLMAAPRQMEPKLRPVARSQATRTSDTSSPSPNGSGSAGRAGRSFLNKGRGAVRG